MTKPIHNVPFTVGEVFKQLEDAKTKKERAEILSDNDGLALRSLLRLNFDPNIKFELPEGTPEKYVPNTKPFGMGDADLKGIVKKFYIFVKESTPNLRQAKREILFLQTLEQLDAFEAKLLIDAKDKKLDFGLTKQLVDEVFPGLLPPSELTKTEEQPKVEKKAEPEKKEETEPVVEKPAETPEEEKEPVVEEPVKAKPKTKAKAKRRTRKKKEEKADEAQSVGKGV